jgi:hypothetical protein
LFTEHGTTPSNYRQSVQIAIDALQRAETDTDNYCIFVRDELRPMFAQGSSDARQQPTENQAPRVSDAGSREDLSDGMTSNIGSSPSGDPRANVRIRIEAAISSLHTAALQAGLRDESPWLSWELSEAAAVDLELGIHKKHGHAPGAYNQAAEAFISGLTSLSSQFTGQQWVSLLLNKLPIFVTRETCRMGHRLTA